MNQLYQSFLLRIWKNMSQNQVEWRASLEDPSTHVIKTFNSPEDLFEYLLQISELDNLSNQRTRGNN